VNYSPLTPEYRTLSFVGPVPAQPYPWYISGKGNLYRFSEDFSFKGDRPFPHFSNFRVPNDLGKNPTAEAIEKANEDSRKLLHSTNEIWKLFSCLDAPPYPGRINHELANHGCELYNDMSCAHCHGTIKSEGETWKVDQYDRSIRNVGTDPLYRLGAKQTVETFERSVTKKWNDQTTALLRKLDPENKYPDELISIGSFKGPADGYQPRPLTALWTRAPYGHNAIFPTVETMMTPENERPAYYKMGDPTSYDFEKMGMTWEPLDKKGYDEYLQKVKEGTFDPTLLVNTKERGRSNKGHSGPAHTVADLNTRRALVECFKVLVP
jgi:hypothetical protein